MKKAIVVPTIKPIGARALREATELFEELRGINFSLKELNKHMELASSGKIECAFGLKIKDLEAKEPLKDIFDEYGFLQLQENDYDIITVPGLFGMERRAVPKKPSKIGLSILNWNIQESTCMLILGALIKEKQKRKEEIILKLKSFGIKQK